MSRSNRSEYKGESKDDPEEPDSPRTLTLLEKAACPILDSYMRGASFTSSLSRFYSLHSPKFSDWTPDSEFRLDQQDCYNQYLRELEMLLEGRLYEFGIDSERFSDILQTLLEDNDDISKQILEEVNIGERERRTVKA